jgi:hypothetical protein
LSADRDEAIPALELDRRRRILGYVVPAINLPYFALKFYEIYNRLQAGMPMNSPDFLNDLILLSLSIGLVILIPSFAPIYASRYWFTGAGLSISRFLKRKITVPYSSVEMVELYIRDEKRGKVSQEAVKAAKENINTMRRTGFKFVDFTNAEESIALVFVEGNKVYMISPAYPKAFAQKLRKKVGRLPVRMIEITPRGKRTIDLNAR